MKEPRVIVVGGGIGGLTAAMVLKKFGAEVEVFERAPTFDPVGAGITIQANAMAVFDALGVTLPAEDVCSIGRFQMITSTGRVLMSGNSDDMDVGFSSVNIHRADLHSALLSELRALNVACHQGCEFRSFVDRDGEVVASFADGSHHRCDLLIGADGMHSVVRQCLLGEAARPTRYSGQTCWRFAMDAPDLVPEVTIERWSPGRRAGVIPLAKGRIYVYLVRSAERGTPGPGSSRPEVLRRHFEGGSEQLDTILHRLDPQVAIHHGDLEDQPQIEFGRDRVVLIGDAAHAMTPNMGQGAGTAIEDAAMLGLAFSESWRDLTSVPAKLKEHRLHRVRRIQTTSWRIGQMAHVRNPVLRWFRDRLLSAMPASSTNKQARSLWLPGVALAADLRDALSEV